MSDLLKLLDNNTISSASARYRDRWIQAKVILITTVLEIQIFFNRISGRDEPIAQFKRRCKTLVQLTHDRMDVFTYRVSTGEYMLIASGANPITEKYSE